MSCPCLLCSEVIKLPRPRLSPAWVTVGDYRWMAAWGSICHPWKEKLQSETQKEQWWPEHLRERFFLPQQQPQIKAAGIVHRASPQWNIYIVIKESGCVLYSQMRRAEVGGGVSQWFFFLRSMSMGDQSCCVSWGRANERTQMGVMSVYWRTRNNTVIFYF